jgi:GNAT superfamily N-acetyltransferase
MHSLYSNPDDRSVLYGLFDVIWRGMATKLETAARFGWQWDMLTTPFVSRAEGRIVSHVGVLDLPVRLGGRDMHVAGVHAVCTHPSHRRRGHFRAAMEEALAFIDARWSTAKLHTDKPWLYEPFGFRVVPQHRFHVDRSGPSGRGCSATTTPPQQRQLHLPILNDGSRR